MTATRDDDRDACVQMLLEAELDERFDVVRQRALDGCRLDREAPAPARPVQSLPVPPEPRPSLLGRLLGTFAVP